MLVVNLLGFLYIILVCQQAMKQTALNSTPNKDSQLSHWEKTLQVLAEAHTTYWAQSPVQAPLPLSHVGPMGTAALPAWSRTKCHVLRWETLLLGGKGNLKTSFTSTEHPLYIQLQRDYGQGHANGSSALKPGGPQLAGLICSAEAEPEPLTSPRQELRTLWGDSVSHLPGPLNQPQAISHPLSLIWRVGWDSGVRISTRNPLDLSRLQTHKLTHKCISSPAGCASLHPRTSPDFSWEISYKCRSRRGIRDGPVMMSTDCSCRGPKFSFQHPHQQLITFCTLALENLASVGTHIYIIKNKISLLQRK